MAESEEIAGLKIGFAADVGELEASLVAARESLNTWLAEQRNKQIKVKVVADKDTGSFDSIIGEVEKRLQSLAEGEPVPIKIQLAPTVESVRASKERIGKALSPVEVEVVGVFAGWKDGKAPTVEAGPKGRGRKAAGEEAAAPSQATQAAGDCCDDIVNAIKALGTKLEAALANAAPGGSNVTREKSAKTSPATAAKAAAENAPAPASTQAAAAAAPAPSTAAAQLATCTVCGWSGPARQLGMHTRWRQHRDAVATKASGAQPNQTASAPTQPRPTPQPSPQPTTGRAFATFEDYLASPGNQAAIASGRADVGMLRRIWARQTGEPAPAEQAPVRPRAETMAAPVETPAAPAPTRREADAARAERYNQPWTCPDCGVTLASSRPSRIKAHTASATHANRTAQRQRATTREARGQPQTPAGAVTTTPEQIAAYRASIGADTAPDLSDVPYRMPGYTPPSQRFVTLPTVTQLLMEAEGMEPGQTGQLPYIDLSGLSGVGKGNRRGRRGTRLARATMNPYDEAGNVRLPAVLQYQNLLAARRALIEQRTPIPEGEQIRQRILATGGSIRPGATLLENAFSFGKDMPAPEQAHILARMRAAGAAQLQQELGPVGGRATPLTEGQIRDFAGELGRMPTDNEMRQRMIELEQAGGDPIAQLFAGLEDAPDLQPITWDDIGVGDFDKKIRAALRSKAGERDDRVQSVLEGLGDAFKNIPDLSEVDLGFEDVQAELVKLLGQGKFADVLAGIGPEMRNLRGAAPGLTNALNRGFLLPSTVPAKAPAMQVQKRFLALNALRETAQSGLQMGATIGEYKPGTGESRAAYEARMAGLAEVLGVPVESLIQPEAEPTPEGPVMATAATQGGAGRRAWLLRQGLPPGTATGKLAGRPERTPEQQAELEALSAAERARRRARFAERLSTRRRPAPGAGAPRRPRWMPEKVGTAYPPVPPSVRAIADERQAGIEYMARLFSYGERTPAQEEQLTFLQGQFPRAVRTARDLYPPEEPEETAERQLREQIAVQRRELARLQTLLRNEAGLSPERRAELGQLEKAYPRAAQYARGNVPAARRLQGLGAALDPLEALRGELSGQVTSLERDVGQLGMAGGGQRAAHEAAATRLAETQRELGLLNQYFPTGKFPDPLARAREMAARPPLTRRNRTLEGERQAAQLILARERMERQSAPRATSEEAAAIRARADAAIAAMTTPPPAPAPAASPQAAAARPRDASGRFTTTAVPTGVRYRGRYVAQQVVRDLGMRGNETPEQAVARMVAANQMNASLQAQIERSFGQPIAQILARAGAAAAAPAAPQPAVAAGAGAPPSPAAAAAAAAARRPAAGAGAPPPPPAPPPGAPPAQPAGQPPQPPGPVPPSGVRYRTLNAILQSARERGVPEGRLAPLQYQRDIGRVPDFPNPFQQRLFGQMPGTLPGGAQPTMAARLLSARAGVAEQVQLTPVRALSVAFGQYAATLGARGGVRGRQLEFEATSQRAQRALNLSEDAFSRRVALREEIKTLQVGSDEHKRATEELKGVRIQHRVLRGRAAELTGETEKLAKGVSGLGTQFANLGFGTLGIVGGTFAFGAAMAAGQAAVGAIAEASKPLVEQLTGYQARVRAVTEGLRDQALPAGDVRGAVAGQLSAAGIPQAVADSIRGELEARTTQSVQNARLGQTVDLMRTAFQTRIEDMGAGVTNFRGVYQPTGGLNLPLIGQTNIGAEQSFLEQAGLAFQRQAGNSGLFNRLFRPDMSFADIGGAAQGNFAAQIYTGQFDQQAARRQFELIRQQSQDLLGIFAGTENVGIRAVNPDLERFEGRGEISPQARAQQAALLRPIAPDVADAIAAGSLAFVDEAGNVVTSLRELDRAFNAAAAEFAKPNAQELLNSMQRPLQAAVMGITDNLRYTLESAQPSQRALQRFISPPTPFGFGMTGATGAAGAAQAAALAQFPAAAGLMQQRQALRARDERALLSIPGVEPAQVRQLRAYGDEVIRVQTAMATRQNQLSGMQYNEQLRIARQQLGDILGLSGQIGGVEQSRVGQLERQNLLIGRRIEDLGREATALQLTQQQRQINFNLATAGFVTSGTTPAEMAANQRQAEREAAFAQQQLDIQRAVFDEQGRLIPNQREIQDTTIERQVEALENAIGLMEEGFNTQQFVQAGQSYLETLAGANAGLLEGMGVIVSAGQQIEQLQIQTRNQIFAQTEEDVDIITRGTREVFEGLLDDYDNFASRIQVPGFEYEPRPTERRAGSGVVPTANAAGWLGQVSAPTTATFGEAGTETIAILRNPRTHTLDGGGSSQPIQLYVNFNGEVSVREEADIQRIAQAVELSLQQKAALLGLLR